MRRWVVSWAIHGGLVFLSLIMMAVVFGWWMPCAWHPCLSLSLLPKPDSSFESGGMAWSLAISSVCFVVGFH